tara:strand:+ start:1315 stop:1782 length:468 start_codon:yes stop_codon:yes gene_type:complete
MSLAGALKGATKGLGEVVTGLPLGKEAIGKGLKEAPLGTLGFGAAGVAAGVPFAWQEVGKPITRGIQEDFIPERDIELQRELSEYRKAQVRERNILNELQRKREETRKIITSLAMMNPQKYNELLVGHTLPKDATVIGGAADMSLLEQFAAQMQG